MKLHTLVKLPNMLKSALLFEELSVTLANCSVLGSKWLCSHCHSPRTGQEKLWHLKKMIKNSLLFIMMEKCHGELNVLSVGKCGSLEKAIDTRVELM